MNGLVALPPAPASPEGSDVTGSAWLPTIDLNLCRDTIRIGAAITHARLRHAVIDAMVWTGQQIAGWRAGQIALGHASLADVPADEIDGESVKVIGVRTAIMHQAAALLADTHADLSATVEGADRAEFKALTAHEHRRIALHAVRQVIDQTTTRVASL